MYIILQILLIGPAAAARERALGRLRAAVREQRAGAEGVAPIPRRLDGEGVGLSFFLTRS